MTQDKSASRSGQGTSTGSAQSTTGMESRSTGDLATQAKETAKQAASQAQEKVSDIASQAQEKVGTQLSGQKDRVAESLGSMAQVLRQTGQQMRDQDQHGITGYVDRVASQVEGLSSYLRDNDMGRLVDDVERFARREPALFLGGAFLLGFLGSRFLKSSRPRPRYDESFYGTSSAYENQYRPYYSGYAAGPDYSGTTGYGTGTNYGGPAGYGTGTTGTTGYGTGTTGTTGYDTGTTGTTGTTGYTSGTDRSRTSSNSGQSSSDQASQRGAGIYDKDREGS